MLEGLQKPAKIELLYRGSQNHFSALKFHEACDNIEDTLTLIKTEFGKTIAGFTHSPWNTRGNYASSGNGSFLMSLDLQVKMEPIRSDKAIFCHKDYGPTFGGGANGHDIFISDGCGSNDYSRCSFPSCFNSVDCGFEWSGSTSEMFCGSVYGNFRVMEY